LLEERERYVHCSLVSTDTTSLGAITTTERTQCHFQTSLSDIDCNLVEYNKKKKKKKKKKRKRKKRKKRRNVRMQLLYYYYYSFAE